MVGPERSPIGEHCVAMMALGEAVYTWYRGWHLVSASPSDVVRIMLMAMKVGQRGGSECAEITIKGGFN